MLGCLASPEFSSVLFFGVVIIFFLPALVWSVVLHHKTPAQSGRIAGIPFKVRVHPPDEVGLVRTADWTGSEKDLNTRRTKNSRHSISAQRARLAGGSMTADRRVFFKGKNGSKWSHW